MEKAASEQWSVYSSWRVVTSELRVVNDIYQLANQPGLCLVPK
jgi:hypothetical protein